MKDQKGKKKKEKEKSQGSIDRKTKIAPVDWRMDGSMDGLGDLKAHHQLRRVQTVYGVCTVLYDG